MNNKPSLKIKAGSRGSPLALAQVKEIFLLLAKRGKKIDHEIATYITAGDRNQATPLSDNVADDFFTDSLDRVLLRGEIDVAIHSAKDLPKVLP